MSGPSHQRPSALRRTTTLATWLSLVLLVVGSLSGAQGLVLCLGADGHIAVEQQAFGDCAGCPEAEAGCPATEASDARDLVQQNVAQHDESGPHSGCECVDISTSVLSTAAPRRATAPVVIDVLARVLELALAAPVQIALIAERADRPRVPCDSGRQRNAVLLS